VKPQAIRFCTSFDGTRIAFAQTGDGPAIVRAPHWLTHLEHELRIAFWRPWIERFSSGRRLLRMDQRGCGLSDWDVADISFNAFIRDLEAVVDEAGLAKPFILFGHSQGAATAIAYAVRHPERVSHLVLLGGYARGIENRELPAAVRGEFEALAQLVEAGWGREDATYRQMFAMQFIPGAGFEQIRAMGELQRAASSPANATRLLRSFYAIDVRDEAARVRCPTLVMHATGDRRIPFEEGRFMASLIPGARFVPLDSANHILLPQEAAFGQFFSELEAFVPVSTGARAREAFGALTPREAEILERIARGLDNGRIAAELGVTGKTVRNNVTRIFDKLGVATRAEAIVLAHDHGIGRQ
jgi:pimeloyl-ACP methyl ester carboxylesterase/DNA-binding CsgD family transcriptional regulator